MISQYLQRADKQFAQTALSPEERAAKLASLHGLRPLSYVLCLLLAVAAVVDFALHRTVSPLLLLLLVVNSFNAQQIMIKIWILEILQKMQNQPRNA